MNEPILGWCLILAPLIGSLVARLTGYFSRIATQLVATGGVAIAFLLSMRLALKMLGPCYVPFQVTGLIWFLGEGYHFALGLWFDALTVLMINMITFISLLVHIYSIAYLKNDPDYCRFFCYLSFFTFAMLLLVGADNLLQLFFGWELVGLASYLLIGFWFERADAIHASFKAFLVNRVGDFGFLLGIALLFRHTKSLHYESIFAHIPILKAQLIGYFNISYPLLEVITLLLFIGAMSKSAQIPLHVWLPESMAGPTPVSALIHAATMVTAGIYMVARLCPLFEHAPATCSLMVVIGSSSALLMGLVAMVQTDIKRIIAFSTLSQLGYMVTALGVLAYTAAILHLIVHAFFKGLLFLAAGSVIVALHHEQDIRKMGGLRRYLPVTYICFLLSVLSLIGLPPFSGFYSKDAIIEAVYIARYLNSSIFISYAFYCLLIAAFVTALYTIRLLVLVFHGTYRGSLLHAFKFKESALMVVPLILLALPTLILGKWLTSVMLQETFLSYGIGTSSLSLKHVLNPPSLGFKPTLFVILGSLVSGFAYWRWPYFPKWAKQKFPTLYNVLKLEYGFNALNQRLWVEGTQSFAQQCARLDHTIIDQKLIHGASKIVYYLAGRVQKLQSGYLYYYLGLMSMSIIGFSYILWW